VERALLIVEDDLDLLDSLGMGLESEGYKVMKASNGQQALDILINLLPNELPACIILDLMMPIMDGSTFLRTIARNHPNDLARIPILVTTARGSASIPYQELPPNSEVFRKPVDLEQLIDAIDRHTKF